MTCQEATPDSDASKPMQVNMARTSRKLASAMAIGLLAMLFVVKGDNVVSCNVRNTLNSGPFLLETAVASGRSRYAISSGETGTFCAIEQAQLYKNTSIHEYSAILSEWTRVGSGYVKGRAILIFYCDPADKKKYMISEKLIRSNIPEKLPEGLPDRQCGHLGEDDLACAVSEIGEQFCAAVQRAN
jgi:hypothetical protein